MTILKPRHILAFLGGIVLVVGCYLGWQMYMGQQMANQYANDAQKLAQGSGNSSESASSQTQGSKEIPSVVSPGQSTPSSGVSTSQAPPIPSAPPNSSAPSTHSGSPAAEDYKLLMLKTYQQTLQAMQNVKATTLSFQGKKLSLSAYKVSILQYQATFSSAEAYVLANPPADAKLNPSYQEFLAGISLAKHSMGVVLNGISSFSPSNFYAAREMGKTAQQQLVNGYSHL